VSSLVVGPVALAVASQTGIDLHAMALTVAVGGGAAFLTPMAHPVNAMTMGTAGYVPRDFARVGAGMMVATLVGLLGVMWLVWGVA
jgi:di/tricarboxylate transporter